VREHAAKNSRFAAGWRGLEGGDTAQGPRWPGPELQAERRRGALFGRRAGTRTGQRAHDGGRAQQKPQERANGCASRLRG
jgi:hypothetical protein